MSSNHGFSGASCKFLGGVAIHVHATLLADAPRDWNIYLHECLEFYSFHVGKYSSLRVAKTGSQWVAIIYSIFLMKGQSFLAFTESTHFPMFRQGSRITSFK